MHSFTYTKDLNQEPIKNYGYYFDEQGMLKSTTDPTKSYTFTNQKDYDNLGKEILLYIQKEVMEKQFKMIRLKGINDSDYVYASNDLFMNKGACLVMIQGSGAIKPG